MLLKKILCLSVFCSVLAVPVFAEDMTVTTDSTKGVMKEELKADREAIKAERSQMLDERIEMNQKRGDLLTQLKAAEQSGDKEKAKQIREQLKDMHKENKGKREDHREKMKALRQERHQDRQAAHEKMREHRQAHKAKKSE